MEQAKTHGQWWRSLGERAAAMTADVAAGLVPASAPIILVQEQWDAVIAISEDMVAIQTKYADIAQEISDAMKRLKENE
jgi:hypothetical protein